MIRFRGKWTIDNFNKNDQILLEYLRAHGYEVISQRIIMRYQPPFVPGILRHNEIAYQIKNIIE